MTQSIRRYSQNPKTTKFLRFKKIVVVFKKKQLTLTKTALELNEDVTSILVKNTSLREIGHYKMEVDA